LFLLLRFSILVILVPVAEEWLIRGWLVRWWTSPDGWYESSLSRVSLASLMMVVVYAVLTHPHEALAAIVWFSLVSWLMVKTGNLFDCIVAHGVTNLLLGMFVIFSEQWRLW
jgi:CAAX prenyl protease-like protein